ncbi:MAG: flavin monoamine oxidase family protein [Bacteriovoracaceae bacterium]
MEKEKVLIIGAGASGLMAARILKQKNIPFTILEATDRIGGRALTQEGSVPIEFGPEYLHGETPLTDALMEEFQLAWYDLEFKFQLYQEGKLRPLPDFWQRLCGVLKDIKVSEDIPFSEYLATLDNHSQFDQKLARSFVQGFDAADLSLMSSLSLSEMKDQACESSMRKLRRPLGGYGVLMRKLAEDLEREIWYAHTVEEIEWGKGEVIVRGYAGEGRVPFEHVCEKIIVTSSIGVLKTIRIHPMPEELNGFLGQTEMGQVVKLVAEMRPEFFHIFDDHNFPFVAAPDLCFTAWWTTTPLHTYTITAWAGGEKARKLEVKTVEERKQLFIQELASITGLCPTKITSWIKVIHQHDWGKDPAFLGAYSYPRVVSDKRVKATTNFEDTLFFAGEAFHEEFSGTMEGAFVTGRDAAQELFESEDHLERTEKENTSIPPYTT